MRRHRFTSAVTAMAVLLFAMLFSESRIAASSIQEEEKVVAMLSEDPDVRQAMAVAASVIPPDQATTDIARLAGEYTFGNGFDLN